MGRDSSDPVMHDIAAAVAGALHEVVGTECDLVMIRESGGVVYLTGLIGSHHQKCECEEVANQVRGVRAVINELRVASQMPRSDDHLAAEVGAAMGADQRLNHLHVDVKVRDGIVFLQGQAGSARERCAVEERVWSVRGVRDVHNGLIIRECLDLPADSIVREIRRRVTDRLGADGQHVDVDIHQGVVYLRGVVPTEEHRWRVEEIVRWERRILDVVNQLEVVGGATRLSQLPPGAVVSPGLGQTISWYRNGFAQQ